MAEYISKKCIYDIIYKYQKDLKNMGAILMLDAIAKEIQKVPVIDVQPVKRGRWIPQGDDMWLCSNCKENIIFSMSKSDRMEKQRYCCRCGARMDIVYQDDKITAIKVTGGDAE